MREGGREGEGGECENVQTTTTKTRESERERGETAEVKEGKKLGSGEKMREIFGEGEKSGKMDYRRRGKG